VQGVVINRINITPAPIGSVDVVVVVVIIIIIIIITIVTLTTTTSLQVLSRARLKDWAALKDLAIDRGIFLTTTGVCVRVCMCLR